MPSWANRMHTVIDLVDIWLLRLIPSYLYSQELERPGNADYRDWKIHGNCVLYLRSDMGGQYRSGV